ncbi:MAG: LamG-like jellyroll fold domain-containing protein, partial [Aeoliella sp.]
MLKNLSFLAVGLCLCGASPAFADLYAYYGFESDLTNASSLPGPDGTDVVGGAAAGTAGGIAGNALELETASEEHMNVAISHGGLGDLGDEFTISVWYNLNNPPGSNASNRYFIFESDVEFDLSYGLRDQGGLGDPGFNDTQSFSQGDGNALFEDAYTPGTWQHVVQTYSTDGGTTTITTYIDGVDANGALTNAAVNFDGDGINFGAARDSANNRGWDGLLDEIAIWDTSLSAGAVLAIYNQGLAGLPIPEPNPI